ncbi:iron transporter [Saccharobesus litoralis]|uniref:Iron transporter n=1 Tax=Saccharobesus litoralis TaxID=2172099 RepID=A0A2S0VXL7_9ALTE|nr:iron transporter [Saccharobesus litoralis]
MVGSRQSYYTEITEDTKKLIELPGTLGDPIAAISTLPGVIIPVAGNEPAVRGSSPADNKYYIDGLPAGYIFHEFNTSIFDRNTVQNFQLYSAGFGAEYAGATGAVFDVRLRDPKKQDIKTTIDASLLRGGIFMEGTVTEDSAFYLSARKGLIQYFMPEEDEDEDDDGVRIKTPPEDNDYLAKYVWDINANNQLTINLVGAGDFAEADFDEKSDMAALNPDFAGEAMLKDRFDSQGITWRHQFATGAELTLSAAHYKNRSKVTWGDNYFENVTFEDTLVKGQLKTPLNESHTLTLGGELDKTDFNYQARSVLFVCTEFDVECQNNRREVFTQDRSIKAREQTAYLIDFWQINANLTLESGLQYTHNDYLDQTQVNPRMAVTWYFLDNVALTSSAGRYNRFPDIETVLPEIGNPKLKAPTAQHYTLGLKGEVADNWNWNIETYYKKLKNLPLGLSEQESDAEQLYANDVTGTAKGVDLIVNRALADGWYGWLSLSYAKSDRTNERTNETRDYRFDTPVVLNLVGNYQINNSWTAGFRFIAKSGEATTKISGIEPNPVFPDKYIATYDQPFNDRLPTYARLDLRLQKDFQMLGNDAKFYIDVINALNRENIVERDLDHEKVNQTGQLFMEEEADLGIFPSIGISFSF